MWGWARICQQHDQWQRNRWKIWEPSYSAPLRRRNHCYYLTTSNGQINTDLITWRQNAREEAIKEVVPDTSSASQAVNIVSDDDE